MQLIIRVVTVILAYNRVVRKLTKLIVIKISQLITLQIKQNSCVRSFVFLFLSKFPNSNRDERKKDSSYPATMLVSINDTCNSNSCEIIYYLSDKRVNRAIIRVICMLINNYQKPTFDVITLDRYLYKKREKKKEMNARHLVN